LFEGESVVAKKRGTIVVKLLSTEGTGVFYVAKRNPRTKPEKMEVRKYDRRARKHVIFKETKIK
jgi:large subunit ribosomal protein L33